VGPDTEISLYFFVSREENTSEENTQKRNTVFIPGVNSSVPISFAEMAGVWHFKELYGYF
jgi:hypothetical protein